MALSGRFSLRCRPYKIHRKKWVRLHVVLYKCYHLHKMHRKFIAKNRVVCTCLFSKEIHALLRPQQAGYAAQISITWPGIDVRSSVRPCLGLSWGELVPILSQITASKGFTLRAGRGYHTKKNALRAHAGLLVALKTIQNKSEKMGPIACCSLHGSST